MERIKLYIIGSVATKGCFEYCSMDVYKDLYEVTGLQYQSSFVSLMSEPVVLDGLDITMLDPWSKKVITRDMNKVFLDELKEINPDYIIIDLISEVEGGLIKLKDKYISNIKGKSNKLNFEKYNIKKFDINNDKDFYVELLKNSLDLFRSFCNNNLPKTKIIFHVAPYLYSYFDENTVTRSFENKGLIAKNKKVRDLYYNYCLKNEDLIIDMSNKTYFSTSKHKLSLNPLHYEHRYYSDFISELNRIVLKEFIGRVKD